MRTCDGRGFVPRLSAARTIPSLYFMARTLVPTILGSLVCVMGATEVSVEQWKDGWTGCIGSMFVTNEDDIVAVMVLGAMRNADAATESDRVCALKYTLN